MGEGAEAGDGVIERRVNLHSLSNHILNLGKSQFTANTYCSLSSPP
jgi:hypothetical protein